MNGIDRITARIETEAVAESARMAQQAKADCEQILAEGEKKAQDSYWQLVRQGVAATEDRVQRLAKTANMEARKSILAYKQALVAQAFEKAEAKLRGIRGAAYTDLLAALAVKASQSGREELVLSARDRAACGQAVTDKANAALTAAGKTGKLTLSKREGDFEGGLLCREGSVSVNCTFDALMAQAREDLATEVAAELFG